MEQNLHGPLLRPRLESLSTGELIELADNYGIDIPSGLERIFIIEELLECANAEEQEEKEEIEINPSYSESVLLPKQYNISFIEVIIRDPLWAFVFWEIKGQDRELYENAEDFNGYYLRVIPLNEGETESKSRENSFTVSIGANDSARYLGFAEHSSLESGRYVIKLGALRGDSELQIASSAPFHLPGLIENEKIAEMSRRPLIRLSGVENLSITRDTVRQSRIKRQ
jgi:hypothetical protein